LVGNPEEIRSKPTAQEQQELQVVVYANATLGGGEQRKPIENYDQTIDVAVRPPSCGEWLGAARGGVDAVQAIVAGIGGVLSAVAGWLGFARSAGRSRARRRRTGRDGGRRRPPSPRLSGASA
jgi:hypothetical protein